MLFAGIAGTRRGFNNSVNLTLQQRRLPRVRSFVDYQSHWAHGVVATVNQRQ